MAIAPANFGPFAGALLVGNFTDGKINAFNATTGAMLGTLDDTTGNPIAIPGLWSLNFGSGAQSEDPGTLYITAGIGGGPNNDPVQSHGLDVYKRQHQTQQQEFHDHSDSYRRYAAGNYRHGPWKCPMVAQRKQRQRTEEKLGFICPHARRAYVSCQGARQADIIIGVVFAHQEPLAMTFSPHKRSALIVSLAAAASVAGFVTLTIAGAEAPSTSVQFSTHLISDQLRGCLLYTSRCV